MESTYSKSSGVKILLLITPLQFYLLCKGSRKKNIFLMTCSLGGGGGKGRAIKEKRTFFILLLYENKRYFT